jgi:hypothetical protein
MPTRIVFTMAGKEGPVSHIVAEDPLEVARRLAQSPGPVPLTSNQSLEEFHVNPANVAYLHKYM